MQCGNRSMPWATQGVDPYYYHGSHVAGVMGAVQNNDLGVTGIANGVKIMVLRVSKASVVVSPDTTSVGGEYQYTRKVISRAVHVLG